MTREFFFPSVINPQPLSRRLLASAATVALILGQVSTASANPVGGVVSSGKATISTPSASTLQIDQSTKIVIINWKSFNIASGEVTKFVQPGASSVAVNRIGGNDPSQILGSLLANGRVVLINGNGIVFGPGSTVNVGSLIATTSDAPDSAIASGKATFDKAGNPNAQIVNQGNITAAQGGLVGLIAPAVSNSGVIAAKLGTVALGASNVFTLDFTGDGLVSFPADGNVVAAAIGKNGKPVEALVVNDGKISGGTVVLTARAAANLVTSVISMKGEIVASAARQAGGKIVLDGGDSGTVNVSGTLDASAGANGDGGTIKVTGATTQFNGTASAKGGSQSGNGGNAEISSHGVLNFTGAVDLSAANGDTGDLLLDPENLTISTGATAHITKSGSTIYTGNANSSVLKVSTLTTALKTANVTVATGSGSTQAGDITVATNVAWTSSHSLTIDAYRNITVNNGVTISNKGSGSLTLYADHGAKDAGTVAFTGTGKVNWSASTGGVNIFYHPTSYASPTSFSSHVTLHSGSKLTAYMTVDKAADLQNVNTNLKGDYALNANISLSSIANFKPIGLDSSGSVANSGKGFTGIFDGQNHTIDKLKITTSGSSSYAYNGLFAYVGTGGIVRNVGLTNVAFSDTGTDHITGPLVGKNMGTVSNSYSTGSAKATGSFIGGLVGSNHGTITSSHSSVTVSDADSAGNGFLYLGGLVEYNAGTISGSYATGAVSETKPGSADDDVGGLVGWNDGGTISGSHATGAVTANGDFNDVGGLAGRSGYTGTSTISSSYATGNVSGSGYTANVGGLVGAVTQTSSVTGSHATGSATGSGQYAFVGGLVGDVTDAGTISSSQASGAVTGGPDSYDGGLVGADLIGTVSGSTASGSVSGGTGSCTGPVIGYPNGTQAGCE